MSAKGVKGPPRSNTRCEREDLLMTLSVPVIVRCQLGKGHQGRHQFLHRWTDIREETK